MWLHETVWFSQVSFGPPTRGHVFKSSEWEILASGLEMSVKEDWGSESKDRHLFQGSALAPTTSECLEARAFCPHLEACAGKGGLETDPFLFGTAPAVLVDKRWCLKARFCKVNQPPGIFVGLIDRTFSARSCHKLNISYKTYMYMDMYVHGNRKLCVSLPV